MARFRRTAASGPITDPDGLSDREAIFVAAYLRDMHLTAAARAAGYRDNQNTHVTASIIARRPRVKAAIDKALAERRKRYAAEAETVLRQVSGIAFSDIRDVITFGPGGVAIHPSHALTPEQAAAIYAITETATTTGTGDKAVTRRTVRIKLHQKLDALELLGDHLGLWTKVNVSLTKDDLTKLSDEALRARAAELIERAIARAGQASTGGAAPE